MSSDPIDNAIALETRALTRRFGGITATDQVSLKIGRGARHALIGPNGAGKTTLINLLTGVLTPSAGSIFIGRSPKALWMPLTFTRSTFL